MSAEEKWMRRALVLAERGRGRVHPNPLVGAVVVQGNRVVGEGWHHAFGQPHAEIEALANAGLKAFGGTLYVTLEPCTHWGKTPPCVDAIIRSGVRRVVIAMRDPNPKAAGGAARLRRHKMLIEIGLLSESARSQNKAFLSWIQEKRPYVILKMASSLDGRASTRTGDSQWITGPVARKAGHLLRSQVDAIAVGAGTLLADKPSLTAHGQGRNPIRIVFAGRRRIVAKGKTFDRFAPTWIIRQPQNASGLRKALKIVSEKGVGTLLVEGGPTLAQSFIDANAIDEVSWFIAPMIIGRTKKLRDALRFQDVEIKRLGDDIRIKGNVHRNH